MCLSKPSEKDIYPARLKSAVFPFFFFISFVGSHPAKKLGNIKGIANDFRAEIS